MPQPPKLGRPTLSSAATKRITITLTDEDLALLDGVSQGNRSDGVRLALRAWHREQTATLADVARIAAEVEADPSMLVSHEELMRRLSAKKAAQHAVAA